MSISRHTVEEGVLETVSFRLEHGVTTVLLTVGRKELIRSWFTCAPVVLSSYRSRHRRDGGGRG
jgi:hypothetical protein